MIAQEAYKIIKDKYPMMVIVECLEFTDFYAFALKEKGYENEPMGGGYHTVNKISGEINSFNLVQDFDAFFTAKQIDIKIFRDISKESLL